MALQIYTPDRTADFRMAGLSALASGIGGGFSQGLASMSEAFTKAQEKKKQLASQGKAADALFKASPELAKLTGMTPEDWALLAPEDKIAAVQGAQGAQAFEEGQRKGRLDVMRLMAAEQELANAEREPAFLNELAQMGQAPEAVPSPMNNEAFDQRTRPVDLAGLAGAAGRTGYRLDMRTADDLLRAANAGKADGEVMAPGEFIEDPITGTRFLTRGKTMLPSGTNPAKMVGEAEPVVDPRTGALLGHNVFNGKTKTFKPVRANEEGVIEIPDPADPMYGPRIRIPMSVAKEQYPHLLKQLAPPAAEPAAETPAKGSTEPRTISTKAEYDQLKSGDVYRDAATGKLKRKK